jgi:hypothetical protein
MSKRFILTTHGRQEFFTSFRRAKTEAKRIARSTRDTVAFNGASALAIVSRRSRPAWRDGFHVGKIVHVIYL